MAATGRARTSGPKATSEHFDALGGMSKADDLGGLLNIGGSPIDTLSLQSLGAYMFFDEVSSDTVKPLCEFIIKANYVFDKSMPLTLLLNTPGGGAYDGFAVVDTMDASRLKISTMVMGAACSMGAVISTAGTPGHRYMTKNSYIMTHQFSDDLQGKYHEFVAHRGHQDDLHERFVKHFVKRTKLKEKQVRELFLGKHDEWITAEAALKYGIIDAIRDPWDDK